MAAIKLRIVQCGTELFTCGPAADVVSQMVIGGAAGFSFGAAVALQPPDGPVETVRMMRASKIPFRLSHEAVGNVFFLRYVLAAEAVVVKQWRI